MIERLLDFAERKNYLLQILEVKTREKTIEILDDQLRQNEIIDITEYYIKGKINGKNVVLHTEDICDPKGILDLLKQNAEIVENTDCDIYPIHRLAPEPAIVAEEKSNREILEDLFSLLFVKEKYPAVYQLNAMYQMTQTEKRLYNTKGAFLEETKETHLFAAEVFIKEGDQTKDSYVGHHSVHPISLTLMQKKLEDKIIETLESFHALSPVTDRYSVVLGNEVVFSILSHFSSVFTAKAIAQKTSFFEGKEHTAIASDQITLIEDPDNREYVGRERFDCEGSPTTYKEIIKDGIFLTKLYDCQTALKENTVSTGNAYESGVIRNCYIKPGSHTEEELFEKMQAGIYVSRIFGVSTGIDSITGNISLQAEGYKIEKGKKTTPLSMMILQTTLSEILENTILVASNLEMFSEQGGACSILVKNITITGKN